MCMIGIEDGYTLAALATVKSPFSDGRAIPIFAIEPNPERVLAAFQIHDWSNDGGPLSNPAFEWIVGNDYTIADMSAWGWIGRASRVLKGEDDPLARFPHIKRWFAEIDARPAAARAREVGKDHTFKASGDEASRRALFPSNYPPAAE